MTARTRVPQSICGLAVLLFIGTSGWAQISSNEREFPQSKAVIEQALASIQTELSGRLPTLDGFAEAGEHSLERYQRGFFQTSVEVTPSLSGGSLVRVTTKVTAWYADPIAARSGYKLLKSNGRLEGDLLDQLADRLAGSPATTAKSAAPNPAPAAKTVASSPVPRQPVAAAKVSANTTAATKASEPDLVSAPVPLLPRESGTFSSSLAANSRNSEAAKKTDSNNFPDASADLVAEAQSLQEALKSQTHPKNLVAVKKSGTPVVSSPSLNAKTLFMASEHDEFELLDFKPDWVHIRISGLSRGWIWRSNVEMPEGIPDTANSSGTAPSASAGQLFKVSREETAPFPGDWAPLRGRNVEIVSIQKTDEAAKDPGLQIRLEFAKSVLDRTYEEIAAKPADLAGVVIIFDSADGGMIAATLNILKQWKAGSLTDAALWHQCFFDPPESDVAGAGGSN